MQKTIVNAKTGAVSVVDMTPEEIATRDAAANNPAEYPLAEWQFKAMVIFLDVDSDIRAAIDQISDPMQKAATLSRYENSDAYRYDDPLVAQLRAAIGMTEEALTSAWLQAKDLRS